MNGLTSCNINDILSHVHATVPSAESIAVNPLDVQMISRVISSADMTYR